MLEIVVAFSLFLAAFLVAGFTLAFLLIFVIRGIQTPDDYYDITTYTATTEPDPDGPTETDLEDYYRAIREGRDQ